MEKENLDELVRSLYLEGLEPKFKSLAYSRFREGKSIEDVYREISALRHRDRGTIVAARKLEEDEKAFLRKLDAPLRKQAYAALMSGKKFSAVKRSIFQAAKKQEALAFEKEEVKFTLGIILKMQGRKLSVPFSYFEVAMNLDVLGTAGEPDYEVFGQMALVMLNTYQDHGGGDDYQKLRSFMFDKINECFERGFIPHPLMFDFMMCGDWISDKTFMMLHVHASELIERGMGGKLVLPLEKMLEKRRTVDNPKHPFSQREEHYFISLINLFQHPKI